MSAMPSRTKAMPAHCASVYPPNMSTVWRTEVPGVAKEDIHVSLEGNVVSLRAEVRQHDEKREGEKVLRSERYYGSVARSFQLPADVDAAQAKAKYDNGVLTLTLPKLANKTAQRLNIE